MVHRLRDAGDQTEPVDREVQTLFHQSQDRPKLLELFLLHRSQWIFFEERHDLFAKMRAVEDRVDHEVFTVVVSSAVAIDAAAAEEVSKQLESLDAPFALRHRELRLNLPTELQLW